MCSRAFITSRIVCVCRRLAVEVLIVFSAVPNQVCTVKAHELAGYIPMESLPEHLGGSSQYSHIAWIQACVNSGQDGLESEDGDCVGNLLRSYSVKQPASVVDLTTGDALNSNLGDDNSCTTNANVHNHYHRPSRTSSSPESPQGHCQHWNGAALGQGSGVTGAGVAVLGVTDGRREKRDSIHGSPNANERCRHPPPPPQSDTPPDTPLYRKYGGGSAGTDGITASGQRDEDSGGPEEDEAGLGVPPLPQKSSRPAPAQNRGLSAGPGPDAEQSVHVPESGGMDLTQLVQYVKKKKKKGIYQEYEEIRKEQPSGSFDYSK